MNTSMHYSRRRCGKGFSYTDTARQTVKDSDLIRFFRSLAIPPAWNDVVITPSKRAKIWATGFDAKGRKQYIYNPKYRRLQEQEKFDRVLRFGLGLACMREVIQKQLRRRKLDRDRVLATMVKILDVAYLRPGNTRYAKENKSYGLTTLRSRHLRIDGDTIIFNFKGKSGKQQRKNISDPQLVQIVRQINELPGTEIFKFIDDEGTIQDVESRDLNAYIRKMMGDEFSAKDFRTWAGTVIAAQALDEMGPVEDSNPQKIKRRIKQAVAQVSEALGNTPAIARKSYIDPRILSWYAKGRTLRHCAHAVKRRANKMPLLSVQELGVICLLQRSAKKNNDMRAIWNGAIGFGLVNIPIKIYSATESSTLDLDMLDKKDLNNIRYKRINEETGKEVLWENIVKGYKIDDKYVVLEDEDFEAAMPEKTKIISITQFVKEQEVDSTLFETPYFLEPQKNGEAAYTLLMKALSKTRMAGIGSFVMREREILAMIRPYDDKLLIINRLRYPHDLRDYSDLNIPTRKSTKAAELKMAEALIKSLAAPFDPTQYKDSYNEQLLKIIKKKAKGKKIKVPTSKEQESKASDLMAMLKASLEKGKKSAS